MHLLAQAATTVEESSGPAWYAYILYAWLAGSIGVYVTRAYRKRVDRGLEPLDGDDVVASGAPKPSRAAGATDAATPSSRKAGAKAPADDSTKDPAASRGRRWGFTDVSKYDEPDPGDGLTPTQRLFRDELAARKGGTDGSDGADGAGADGGRSSGRGGFFAAEGDDGDTDEAPRRPVSELLSGISLPCDLAPITASTPPGPHLAAFGTTSHPPAEVGRRLGDELERLGFSLESTTATDLEARRDGEVLHVALHPDAAKAVVGKQRLFPSAAPRTVGVVFRS